LPNKSKDYDLIKQQLAFKKNYKYVDIDEFFLLYTNTSDRLKWQQQLSLKPNIDASFTRQQTEKPFKIYLLK